MNRHPLRHINTFWLALVAVVLVTLALNPEWVSRESIADLLSGLGAGALGVYIAMSLSRAVLLIPCTPFVLAGGITFPEIPVAILIISLTGVVVGGYLVYSFPSLGDYDEYLEQKYPEKIARLKVHMHGPWSFWIMVGWSFFPLVPTDVICYVAGMTGLRYRKLALALLVGSIPLVTVYIFVGSEIGLWLRV